MSLQHILKIVNFCLYVKRSIFSFQKRAIVFLALLCTKRVSKIVDFVSKNALWNGIFPQEMFNFFNAFLWCLLNAWKIKKLVHFLIGEMHYENARFWPVHRTSESAGNLYVLESRQCKHQRWPARARRASPTCQCIKHVRRQHGAG